jgi:hypothetical protein
LNKEYNKERIKCIILSHYLLILCKKIHNIVVAKGSSHLTDFFGTTFHEIEPAADSLSNDALRQDNEYIQSLKTNKILSGLYTKYINYKNKFEIKKIEPLHGLTDGLTVIIY